jgi:hypothetical protein
MVNKVSGRPNIDKILKQEVEVRKGSMMVSGKVSTAQKAGQARLTTFPVCANSAVATEIRSGVQRWMAEEVQLVELDFEPSLRRSKKESREEDGKDDATEMDFKCRGDV